MQTSLRAHRNRREWVFRTTMLDILPIVRRCRLKQNGLPIMTGDIRAFLAIQLHDEVKAELGLLIDQVNQARVGGLKPVRPENMHITLKFFGNVSPAQADSIAETITHTAQVIRPFQLRLGNVGAFPSAKNPRVLWVGLDGDVASLQEAHRRIETALGDINIKPDSREFRPHLTIARLRDRTSPTERRRAAEAMFSAQYRTGIPIPVVGLSLMRSILLKEGPQYETLAEIALSQDG